MTDAPQSAAPPRTGPTPRRRKGLAVLAGLGLLVGGGIGGFALGNGLAGDHGGGPGLHQSRHEGEGFSRPGPGRQGAPTPGTGSNETGGTGTGGTGPTTGTGGSGLMTSAFVLMPVVRA